MNTQRQILPVVLVAAGSLLMGAAAAPASDGDDQTGQLGQFDQVRLDEVDLIIEDLMDATAGNPWRVFGSQAAGGDFFAESEIFFEENATDGDLGLQLFLDGDAWKRVIILNTHLRRLVDIKVSGNAGVIGLTEFFSESAEPSFDELPRDEFLALFPAGKYLMLGKTIEGDWLFGVARLTQNLPEQPEITAPEEEAEVDPDEPLVIEWETVPDPDAPDSEIVAYHVVVEKDEEDERLRVWTADMLPTDTTVTVPVGFLEPGKDYKVEILAIETSNNKTITEIEFETED